MEKNYTPLFLVLSFLPALTISGFTARDLGLHVGPDNEIPALEGLVKLLSDDDGRQALREAMLPIFKKKTTAEVMKKLTQPTRREDEEDSASCEACEVRKSNIWPLVWELHQKFWKSWIGFKFQWNDAASRTVQMGFRQNSKSFAALDKLSLQVVNLTNRSLILILHCL